MPDRRGLAQLRRRRDLKIDAERIERLTHRVDHELVFVAILGRSGEGGTAGLVGVRVRQARGRSGERSAGHLVATPRDEKLGARADEGGTRVTTACRRE